MGGNNFPSFPFWKRWHEVTEGGKFLSLRVVQLFEPRGNPDYLSIFLSSDYFVGTAIAFAHTTPIPPLPNPPPRYGWGTKNINLTHQNYYFIV